MTSCLETSCSHLPSRREALIGSGALFAWTQLPKLARAEGRDPRMLVIVLAGRLGRLGGSGAGRRSGLGRVAG